MTAIRSTENADLICQMTASGWSVNQIAKELGCTEGAIRIWRAEDPIFRDKFNLAKQAQMDMFADELLEIADDGSNDWMERDGFTVVNAEHIARSRLRVDTRKWLMAKMAPKRFGDRVEHDHTGLVDVVYSVEDRRQRARAIIDAAFEDVTQHGQIEDARSEAPAPADGED